MARTPKTEAARKSVQMSTSIDPDLFDALDDYRWANKLEKTDVMRLALQEFAVNHGIKVVATEDSPAGE